MLHTRPCARTRLRRLAAAAGAGVLLIPGTGSTGHLRENLVAEHVALDDQALRELAGVSMWPS
jgi:aryl-alcohol dehydrogenase-like predicted oxidoreductase